MRNIEHERVTRIINIVVYIFENPVTETYTQYSDRTHEDYYFRVRSCSYVKHRVLAACRRFSEKNEGSISKVAFQPFGIGPRNCAGMRLALLEIAYTVVKMTQHFRWELGDSQLASSISKRITAGDIKANEANHESQKWVVLTLSSLCTHHQRLKLSRAESNAGPLCVIALAGDRKRKRTDERHNSAPF